LLVPTAEGGLERGGVSHRAEAPRRARLEGRPPTLKRGGDERVAGGLGGVASSEAEMVPRVRVRPRMGRTAELGRGPCTDRASLGLGEDLGAVGELEELQDIRVQSDD